MPSPSGFTRNLITSAIPLNEQRVAELADAGLDHVQISFQDADEANGDHVAGMKGAQAKKREVAAMVRRSGMPLTINLVVHRQNLGNLAAMLDMAVGLGAARIEVAHVQYYGWALANRAALLPSRAQLDAATEEVETRPRAPRRRRGDRLCRARLLRALCRNPAWADGDGGSCTVSPVGHVSAVPCGRKPARLRVRLRCASARLGDIWRDSEAFRRFRGTDWMPEPCASCDRREIDWGGCRCQAFALTGDAAATDPACGKSPHHALLDHAVRDARDAPPGFIYRRIGVTPEMPLPLTAG